MLITPLTGTATDAVEQQRVSLLSSYYYNRDLHFTHSQFTLIRFISILDCTVFGLCIVYLTWFLFTFSIHQYSWYIYDYDEKHERDNYIFDTHGTIHHYKFQISCFYHLICYCSYI